MFVYQMFAGLSLSEVREVEYCKHFQPMLNNEEVHPRHYYKNLLPLNYCKVGLCWPFLVTYIY